MKKIVFILLAAVFSLSTLSAAKELMMFGMSGGYNEVNGGGEIGFYTQYQVGIEINNKFSIGGGAYLSSDFHMGKTKASNATNATIGPAFSVSFNDSITLASVIGFESMIITSDNYDDFGYGAGGTVSLNFIPQSERESRVQLGFTIGANLSLIYFDKIDYQRLSGRAFFGFTLSQPFFPRTYYPRRLYDAIIDTYFYPYN